MTDSIDGIYSVVVAGISGSALATIRIADGKIHGNDTGGGWWWGYSKREGEGFRFQLKVKVMPGVFGVWGGSAFNSPVTLSADEFIPEHAFISATPYIIPSYKLTMIFTRIPDEYGYLADQGGLEDFIGMMNSLRESWKDNDRPMP